MYDPYLAHYGVKGMKWGVRRYQRKDGTLTNAGKRRKRKAEAKREDLAKNAKRMSNYFSRSARDAEKHLDDTKKMRSEEFSKWYDDDEFLAAIGGLEGAKKVAVADLESSIARYRDYAQEWMKMHDRILKAPVEEFYSKDTWKKYRYLV